MSKIQVLVAVLVVTVLAACANQPYAQNQQQRQQAYNATAGAPVRSFNLASGAQIYSWEALSDSQLVIYTMPKRAFLLDVWPCSTLVTTTSIGLTSFANQVQTGFDKVLTRRPNIPCVIKQIRPIDLAQFKLDRESQRQVDSMPRDNGNTPAAATSR